METNTNRHIKDQVDDDDFQQRLINYAIEQSEFSSSRGVNLSETQISFRRKVEATYDIDQLKTLLLDIYKVIIKCEYESNPDVLSSVSNLINAWYPSYNVKKIAKNDDTEYIDSKAEKLFRTSNFGKGVNKVPFPIKCYISVFSTISLCCIVFLALSLTSVIRIIPIYYIFLVFLCSTLLVATAIYAMREWKRRGKWLER